MYNRDAFEEQARKEAIAEEVAALKPVAICIILATFTFIAIQVWGA